MRPALRSAALAFVLVVAGLGLVLGVAPTAHAAPVFPAASAPVSGNVSGPSALGVSASGVYYINATGGPAVAPNGTIVGTLEWNVTVSASNTTNVTVSPATGQITSTTPGTTTLTVSNLTQAVTLVVRLTSILGSANASTTITHVVQVVQPYVLWATLIAGPVVTVLPFTLVVELDGTTVGTVKVPTLTANETYNLTYDYATTGLSSGYHTFTISVAAEHGLVTFANGQTVYSATFYVTGPPPNDTIWVVLGIVAFAGTLFILATRVAARRRGATRR